MTSSTPPDRLSLRVRAWRYPWFTAKALLRGALRQLARDIPLSRTATDEAWAVRDEDVPPHLAQFTRGELLKWKGVELRVLKVVGNPTPALILVPIAATHGRKLRAYRAARRAQKLEARHVAS